MAGCWEACAGWSRLWLDRLCVLAVSGQKEVSKAEIVDRAFFDEMRLIHGAAENLGGLGDLGDCYPSRGQSVHGVQTPEFFR